MSVIDEIKARLDIVSYIQQYTDLKRAGRTYKACCPFHAEKTPSFVVNPDKGTWRCFGACNEGGDVFSFAQKYHHWSFPEALEELGKLAGVETRPHSPIDRQRDEHHDKLRGLMQTAAQYFHAQLLNGSPASADVLRYAKEKRGFTDETITRYQIGYAPQGWQNLHDEMVKLGYTEADLQETGLLSQNDAGKVYDRFRHRLMIPIRDERGRVIAFGARALAPDDQPKYLNSPQTPLFDKSRTLFGLDVAKTVISQSEIAVIVEGYMDVIQAHQAGFYNVVAQMGTALTEMQLKLLAPRYAKKIILALDSDTAGQKATRKSIDVALELLRADYSHKFKVEMCVLQIPSAKDPDDLIRETPNLWQHLVATAMPALEFVINTETAHLPVGAEVRQVPVWEREQIAKQILPFLITTESDAIRKDNLQHLALRLYLDYRDVAGWAQILRHQVDLQRTREQMQLPKITTPNPAPDEPPPIDYANAEPPPEGNQADLPVPDDAPIPTHPMGEDWSPITVHKPPSVAISDRALEAHCLQMLFKSPNVYYLISRKFRALANHDEQLSKDYLNALTHRDFVQGEYQHLMGLFIEALAQQDEAFSAYIEGNLPPHLRMVWERLNSDVATRQQQHMKHHMSADYQDVAQKIVLEWSEDDIRHQAIYTALRLRRLRVEQELQEFQLLLTDMTNTDPLYNEVRRRINMLSKARRAIDIGIKEEKRP